MVELEHFVVVCNSNVGQKLITIFKKIRGLSTAQTVRLILNTDYWYIFLVYLIFMKIVQCILLRFFVGWWVKWHVLSIWHSANRKSAFGKPHLINRFDVWFFVFCFVSKHLSMYCCRWCHVKLLHWIPSTFLIRIYRYYWQFESLVHLTASSK